MSHNWQLLSSVVGALVVIVILISAVKLPPFLAILVGAFVAGVSGGLPVLDISKHFSEGAGELLGSAGLIIALGSMLGAILTATGAADRISGALLSITNDKFLPWMMALIAMIVGLPLFFEVGLVVMVPLIFVIVERSKQPLLKVAIPALAGMTTLHALMPPHPGPLIVITTLHVDLGLTMLIGLGISVVAVILAGPLYAYWLSPRLVIENTSTTTSHAKLTVPSQLPSLVLSLVIILLPAILMLGKTVSTFFLTKGTLFSTLLNFLGEPLVALTITVLFASLTLGWYGALGFKQTGQVLQKSAAPVAALLLTIGAGGGLKQILLACGVSDSISHFANQLHMPNVLLGWVIAALLRQATGSATVATATTAGIMAPLLMGISPVEGSLVALSIGAGSVFFCQLNDAAFWMVKEYFALSLKQTFAVWSALQSIVSVVGLAGTYILYRLLVA